MIAAPRKAPVDDLGRLRAGVALLAALALLAGLPLAGHALPARLVLALDGVAYRDLQTLQAGITRTNFWGRTRRLQAFTATEGYFPVGRLISTFPSISDVAWTDIFGDRPLPGYQRTYYSAAANSLMAFDGVTTTMEYERQMDWQAQNKLVRAMGYLFPERSFCYEMHGLAVDFFNRASQPRTYYAYFRASDDAQHLDRDIFALLCQLDQQLQKLRARYQAREGRDLEIVMLSDHGHNHAGRGIRVRPRAFLEQAGYHVVNSISGPRDVVLPIAGVESWVEVHCDPRATEKLAGLLCQLTGVEVLAAAVPDQSNRFLVMNAKGERAGLEWNPSRNSFRYAPVDGDPLKYRPVLDALARNHQLEAGDFASAESWTAATMSHHYPLALERIAQGLTRGALNPATILISLDNRYVNDSWPVQQGSRLVDCGSTHGGLDDLCSDGILLSNFTPTRDTSTARVAGQFNNFFDVKDYHAVETGAELVTKPEESLTRILRDPVDRDFQQSPGEGIYLRIWSPQLAALDGQAPLTVAIEKLPRYSTSPRPQRLMLDQPLPLSAGRASERIYALPAGLRLEPLAEYRLSGWIQQPAKVGPLFIFSFRTSQEGRPVPF